MIELNIKVEGDKLEESFRKRQVTMGEIGLALIALKQREQELINGAQSDRDFIIREEGEDNEE